MITVIPEFPPHVAAFRVTGKVTAHDYRSAVVPVLQQLSGRTDRLQVLMDIRTDISNYSLGAWIADFMVDVRYFAKWDRVAVISDQVMVSLMSAVADKVIPGTIRVYLPKSFGQAKRWVSAGA